MAVKLLGVQALEMYEKMINKEFEPIIDILKARGNSVRGEVVQAAKKKFGLYELEAKIKTLAIRLEELKDERSNITGFSTHYSDNQSFAGDSILGKEVSRVMDQLNPEFAEIKEKRDTAIKQLRLAGLPEEIQNVFKELEDTVLKLTSDIKKLPPINKGLKQIKKK